MAASSSTNVRLEGDQKTRIVIVWLHDKDEHFLESVQFVKSLKLNNVEWICPPMVYTNTSYGFGCNIKQDDQEALDSASNLVADLFLREPPNVVKGVGGFGMGAVVALQFATKCALGHYPINPRVVVGINGWLSITERITRSIKYTFGALARASSQAIFITHGTDDRALPYTLEEEITKSLRDAGFGEVCFFPFSTLRQIGHVNQYTPNITDHLKLWLELKIPIPQTKPLP